MLHAFLDNVRFGADHLATLVELLALAVLAVGVWRASRAWFALRPWTRRPTGSLASIRIGLGAQILVALELLICADIMHSVIRRSLEDLVVLGAVVVIRTLIAFFLNRELRDERADDTDGRLPGEPAA